MGRFTRDGRTICLLVNVGEEPYTGQLSPEPKKVWTRMDPSSGAIEPVAADAQNRLPLALDRHQAALLVGSE
jgi:hypothetical protein